MKAKRAFTLIEMLVVLFILALLAGAVVAVGAQVKATAARKSTLATLKTLDALMADYLAAGNPEPQPETLVEWSYGPPAASGFPGYNSQYHGNPPPPVIWLPTATASDPIRWVKALRTVPETARKLETLPKGLDITVRQGATTYGTVRENGVGPNMTILDAWGNAIRYIPSSGERRGYFMSAGPDGKFHDVSSSIYQSGFDSWQGYPVAKDDDVFSRDAH